MASQFADGAYLEGKIRRLLGAAQPLSALPLAEVLASLDENNDTYTILYAEVLYSVREYEAAYRTVCKILQKVEAGCGSGGSLGDVYPQALGVAMKSSFEVGNVKDCYRYAEQLLAVAGIEDAHVVALCYAARCAELTGDPQKAVVSYRTALQVDPLCGEAMNALIDRHLLSVGALREVVYALRLPPGAEVMRATYLAKIGDRDFLRAVPTDEQAAGCIPAANRVLAAAAKEFHENNLVEAAQLTSEAVALSPYNRAAVCMRLTVLVDMKATPKLFDQAQTLSKSKTHPELAAYAIGCFYFSLLNFEKAGRYFSRATEIDPGFAEAWIAYGHCYAKLEEGEQALGVYRRTLNAFPGLYQCNVFVGMQYSRIHQWPLAINFLEEARKQTPNDTLVLNEMGVVLLKLHQVEEALEFFQLAWESMENPHNPSEHRDCVLFNLATVYRKLRRYNEAIEYYIAYVKCRPNASHGHCALAFTYHLMGNLKAAITRYHIACSLKTDAFCRDMLDRALLSEFGRNAGGPGWGDAKDIGDFGTNTCGSDHGVGGGLFSPCPTEVSFASVSRTIRSESRTAGSVRPSPRPSVGRSLMF